MSKVKKFIFYDNMHKLNILLSGPNNFISTINELKQYLKFNLKYNDKKSLDISLINFDVLIFHHNSYEILKQKNDFKKIKNIKILITKKKSKFSDKFDAIITLPTSIKEINEIVETSFAKKQFNLNSSIKIKKYFLDKNEKRLIKDNFYIILTEKEIKLLELFLIKKKAISKNEILSLVWHYSEDADTHTVETHIYRLRKKIQEKFLDNNFILNNKDGYYL